MSTRHVRPGERRKQNGWASAPEYDVLRGINGTAVAFKAALQTDPKARELLFALQALSLREGGVKRTVRELVEMFPERIGTPEMFKIGCKPGMRLSKEEYGAIYSEVNSTSRDAWYEDDNEWWAAILGKDPVSKKPKPYVADARAVQKFLDACVHKCENNLPEFIEELCCDPKMEVASELNSRVNYEGIVELVLDDARRNLEADPKLAKERPDLAFAVEHDNRFRAANFNYFQDVLGALFEYVRRGATKIQTDFVETSISKIVFDAFDYVLETGRSALVEGPSGSGKTTALKACCEMNPGRSRYLQLSGITSRTAFLRRIADVCGVANGGGMSTDRIQTRVEAFLKRTKLALIIDEAQYLWPQGKRITSHPELVNWLNTSLYNEGVPFLLSATQQFTTRRQAVENQTDWISEQSRRRTRKVFPLPEKPTAGDLQAVARKLLGSVGDLGESAVDLVVGYALTSRGYFQTITDAVDDARLIAKRAGRDRITFKDLKVAIYEWRAQSDVALQRVFDSKPEGRRRTRAEAPEAMESAPVEPPNNEPLIVHSRGLKPSFSSPETPRRSTRPEAVAALTG